MRPRLIFAQRNALTQSPELLANGEMNIHKIISRSSFCFIRIQGHIKICSCIY